MPSRSLGICTGHHRHSMVTHGATYALPVVPIGFNLVKLSNEQTSRERLLGAYWEPQRDFVWPTGTSAGLQVQWPQLRLAGPPSQGAHVPVGQTDGQVTSYACGLRKGHHSGGRSRTDSQFGSGPESGSWAGPVEVKPRQGHGPRCSPRQLPVGIWGANKPG